MTILLELLGYSALLFFCIVGVVATGVEIHRRIKQKLTLRELALLKKKEDEEAELPIIRPIGRNNNDLHNWFLDWLADRRGVLRFKVNDCTLLTLEEMQAGINAINSAFKTDASIDDIGEEPKMVYKFTKLMRTRLPRAFKHK